MNFNIEYNQVIGRTVSMDGIYSVTGDANTGHIYIHKRDLSGEWIRTVIDYGASSGAGESLSIYRDSIAIGCSGDISVRILQEEQFSLSQTVSTIVAEGSVSFGKSISIRENLMVVGDPGTDSNRGSIFIFEKESLGKWLNNHSYKEVVPDIRSSNQYFGYSVSVGDGFVAVGAIGENNYTGAIFIFEKDEETGEWIQSYKILASDGREGDRLGTSLSLSGEYMASGAEFKTVGEEIRAGAVYVYKYVNRWYEVSKIFGSGENSLEANYFGNKLELKDGYLIVGSPGARNRGVAYLFSQKRNWGLLNKFDDISVLDGEFGGGVSVSYPYFSITAPETNSQLGTNVIYKEPPIVFRAAQEFNVNREYLPSKASIFLRRAGKNRLNYWLLSNSQDTVIDCSNFLNITKNGNVVIFSDEMEDFTGNGYMYMDRDDETDFNIVNYPIRSFSSETFYVWIRCYSQKTGYFKSELLLDGKVVDSYDSFLNNPSAIEWEWVKMKMIIPDESIHSMGIKIKEKGCSIDKLYITTTDNSPYGEGPNNSISPYVTIHSQLYESDGEKPSTSLFIYDYKNTVDEVIGDDWYNFIIKSNDKYHGYMDSSDFVGSFFIVVSTSGDDSENYVIWEMVENDEYMSFPSVFRI